MEKRSASYEAPSIKVLGSVAELTLALQVGPNVDIQGDSPSFP